MAKIKTHNVTIRKYKFSIPERISFDGVNCIDNTEIKQALICLSKQTLDLKNRATTFLYRSAEDISIPLANHKGIPLHEAYKEVILSKLPSEDWGNESISLWGEKFGCIEHGEKAKGRPKSEKTPSISFNRGGKSYNVLCKSSYRFLGELLSSSTGISIQRGFSSNIDQEALIHFTDNDFGKELVEYTRNVPIYKNPFIFYPKESVSFQREKGLTASQCTYWLFKPKKESKVLELTPQEGLVVTYKYKNSGETKVGYLVLPNNDDIKKAPYMMDLLYMAEGLNDFTFGDSKITFNGKDFCWDVPMKSPVKKTEASLDNGTIMGVDFGIVNPLVASLYFSETNKFQNSPYYIGAENQVRDLFLKHQSHKRRMQSVSSDRKNKLIAGHWWEKASDNLFHIYTKRLVDLAVSKRAKYIAIEDLTNLAKRALATFPVGKFKSILKYKAELQNIQVLEINPYNTSKTCSCCGWVHKEPKKVKPKKLKKGEIKVEEEVKKVIPTIGRINQSTFVCGNMGCSIYNRKINADSNASKNIARRGKELLDYWAKSREDKAKKALAEISVEESVTF